MQRDKCRDDLLEKSAGVCISSPQRRFGRPLSTSGPRVIPAKVHPMRSLTPIRFGVLVAANSS